MTLHGQTHIKQTRWHPLENSLEKATDLS